MAFVGHVPGRFIENFHGTALELKFSPDLKTFWGVYSPALAHKPVPRPVVSANGHVLVQEDAPDAKLLKLSDTTLRNRHNPELNKKEGGGLLRKSRLVGTIKRHRPCQGGSSINDHGTDHVHSPLHDGGVDTLGLGLPGAGSDTAPPGAGVKVGPADGATDTEIANAALRQLGVGGDGSQVTSGLSAHALGEAGATGVTLVGIGMGCFRSFMRHDLYPQPRFKLSDTQIATLHIPT